MMLLISVLTGSVIFCSLLGPVFILWYNKSRLRARREEILDFVNEEALGRYEDAFYVGEAWQEESGQQRKKRIVGGLFHRAHSWQQYVLAILLLLVPTSFGLSVCALWIHDRLRSAETPVGGIPEAIILAFLGGYVWSLYELLGRIHTGDLTAHSASEIAYRVIVSVPVGYAFSLLGAEGMTSFFAFAASAFPLRDLRRWMRRFALQRLQEKPASVPREMVIDRLGHAITGLSDETLARLEEIHVSTNLDMAYLDPLRLYVETGVPLRCAVDWIDQAIWSLYVGPTIRKLQPMGVRSAIEASNLYAGIQVDDEGNPRPKKDWEKAPEILCLSEALGKHVTPRMVLKMLEEVDKDPHVELLSALWGEEA